MSPHKGIVGIGKILRRDESSGLSLTLVRGIFQTEREARNLMAAFGCDVLLFSAPGQIVELGQLAMVETKNVQGVVGE